MQRLIVTGGAGFIGRRLVRRLVAAGREVLILDDLSTGAVDLATDAPVERCDVRDEDAVNRAFAGFRPDGVVHLAALHQIRLCDADPRRAMDINVVGAQTVLDAAARAGVGHVALASTGAVYDWIDGPLAEDSAVVPRDVYSLTKASNERQGAIWAQRTGGAVQIARLFNVIGAGDTNAHLVPDLLSRLVGRRSGDHGGPVPLALGNRDSRRDYLSVEDAADGLFAMLQRRSDEPVDVYNLCSGHEHRVADIAEKVAAAIKVPITLGHDPTLVRRFDRPSQLGDPAKSWARLAWRATTPLDRVIAEMIAADPRFAAA